MASCWRARRLGRQRKGGRVESTTASSIEQPAAGAVDVILRDGGTLRLRAPPARRRRRPPRVSSTALRAEPVPAVPRLPHGRRPRSSSPSSTPTGSSAARSSAAWRTAGARSASSRSRATRGCATETAEVAFAVADAEQGRGIGTRLLEQLAGRARDAGIDALRRRGARRRTPAMLGVFARRRLRARRARSTSGEVEVRFPIAPTGAYAARVEERDHVAVAASLRPFFEPASVAVIGASRRRGSIGGELFRNILAGRLRRRRLPGQPQRRAGRRRPRLPRRSRRSPTRSTSR